MYIDAWLKGSSQTSRRMKLGKRALVEEEQILRIRLVTVRVIVFQAEIWHILENESEEVEVGETMV